MIIVILRVPVQFVPAVKKNLEPKYDRYLH